MPVRIRLRRVGRKKQPSYRMVVADQRAARDGAYIDIVGHYNPRTKPAQLRVDLEKVDYWVGQGASLSDTAASLVKKARKGGDDVVTLKTPEELRQEAVAARAAAAPAEPAKPKRTRKAAAAPAAEAAEEPVAAEAEPAASGEAEAEASAEAEPEAAETGEEPAPE